MRFYLASPWSLPVCLSVNNGKVGTLSSSFNLRLEKQNIFNFVHITFVHGNIMLWWNVSREKLLSLKISRFEYIQFQTYHGLSSATKEWRSFSINCTYQCSLQLLPVILVLQKKCFTSSNVGSKKRQPRTKGLDQPSDAGYRLLFEKSIQVWYSILCN